MNKTGFHVLAVYELGRLGFFLILHANLNNLQSSFGWHVAAPLLGIPLLLIYAMISTIKSSDEQKDNNPMQAMLFQLFVIQKVASTTGLVLYTISYTIKLTTNVLIDGVYFIEMIPFVVIFFVIDAILCTILLLKQSNKKKRLEE